MRVRKRTPARTRAPSISDNSTSFHAPGAKYSRRAFRPEKIRAMKSRHCPRTGAASGTSAFPSASVTWKLSPSSQRCGL